MRTGEGEKRVNLNNNPIARLSNAKKILLIAVGIIAFAAIGQKVAPVEQKEVRLSDREIIQLEAQRLQNFCEENPDKCYK